MINVAFYGNGSGATVWRLTDPAKYLALSGDFDIRVPESGMAEVDLQWADIIVIQGLVDKELLAYLYMYQQEAGKRIIVEFDDYIVVEKDSPHKQEHVMHQVPEVMAIAMGFADMVTTTTDVLAKRFSKFNKNVRVLPNFMDPDRWFLEPQRHNEPEVRIGWAGSLTHYKDFKECARGLNKIMGEFPQVKVCLSGDPRNADWLKYEDRVNYYQFPNIRDSLHGYTSKLNSMRWDIGIAPLRDTVFNKGKSNIKPMEYGIFEIPCVASRVEPYKYFDGHVALATTKEEWYRELKLLVEDENLRRKTGAAMREWVIKTHDLSKNAHLWVEAYKSLV